MAVMAREAWTDERLDHLNHNVDEGFIEMRGEFKAVRGEMREEFSVVRSEMRNEFQAMRTEMGEVRSEVNALARVIMQLTWGLIGTMLVGFLGVMATIITKF